jgi:hypothetical protein
MKIYALSLALGLLTTGNALAADTCTPPAPEACKEVQTCGSPDCCAHCGGHGCCQKYCRVVCEMKEVKKTVWAVKCEDFCAPLPSCPLHCNECCKSCQEESCKVCTCGTDCGKTCDPCADLENRNYYPPNCGKVRTKKTLEKKEITCKIPSYKCVVVYACPECGQKCAEGAKSESSPPAAPEPPPAPAPTPTKTTVTMPSPSVVKTAYIR